MPHPWSPRWRVRLHFAEKCLWAGSVAACARSSLCYRGSDGLPLGSSSFSILLLSWRRQGKCRSCSLFPLQVALCWIPPSTEFPATHTQWSMKSGTAWDSTTSSGESRRSSPAATRAWKPSRPSRLGTSAVTPTPLLSTSSVGILYLATTRAVFTVS